jgi:hypothetical protein
MVFGFFERISKIRVSQDTVTVLVAVTPLSVDMTRVIVPDDTDGLMFIFPFSISFVFSRFVSIVSEDIDTTHHLLDEGLPDGQLVSRVNNVVTTAGVESVYVNIKLNLSKFHNFSVPVFSSEKVTMLLAELLRAV